MPNYAVIDENNVVNTILADSKAVAEEVTGMTCIEYTTEPAEPGGTWDGTKFFPRKPYESWTWNEEIKYWQSPVPYPTQEDPENPKFYVWDEDTLTWKE